MRKDTPDEGDAIRALLVYAFLPFWLVPGILDYSYHRKTKIEETSGARESLMHGLMFASTGVPVTLALLCEIDPFVLALSAFTALVHEALTIYDVAYAAPRRDTPPSEQHVHAFLEVMPLAGTLMLVGAHPAAALELIKNPIAAFKPRFARKRRPVPRPYLVSFFAAVGALIVLPYGEEFVRCLRRHPTLRELPTADERERHRA